MRKFLLIIALSFVLTINSFADNIKNCGVFYDGAYVNKNINSAIVVDNISYLDIDLMNKITGINFKLIDDKLEYSLNGKLNILKLDKEVLKNVKKYNKLPIRILSESIGKLVQFDYKNFNVIISDNKKIDKSEKEMEYFNKINNYSLLLPIQWKSGVEIIEKSGDLYFYEKKSYEEYLKTKDLINSYEEKPGFLFSICALDNINCYDTSIKLLGFNDGKYIICKKSNSKKYSKDYKSMYLKFYDEIDLVLQKINFNLFSNLESDEAIFGLMKAHLDDIYSEMNYTNLKNHNAYLPTSIIYTLDNDYDNLNLYDNFKNSVNDKKEARIIFAKSENGVDYSLEYIVFAKSKIYLLIDRNHNKKSNLIYGNTYIKYDNISELLKGLYLTNSDKESIKTLLKNILCMNDNEKILKEYKYFSLATEINDKKETILKNSFEKDYIVKDFIDNLTIKDREILNKNYLELKKYISDNSEFKSIEFLLKDFIKN